MDTINSTFDTISTLKWAQARPVYAPDERLVIPLIEPSSFRQMLSGHTIWDQTPVLDEHGHPVSLDGLELWLFLCADKALTGDERHFHNRLRLVAKNNKQWLDSGYLLPDGFSHGTREWAGVGYLKNQRLTLYYTAAGEPDSSQPSFKQRIFKASGELLIDGAVVEVVDWADDGEVLTPDSRWYDDSNENARFEHGIKAFRDPFWFRDAQRDREYLLIAATKAQSDDERDACIALAIFDKQTGLWNMKPPILDAQGVTYEVERPHSLWHNNKLYVFWSVHGWTTMEPNKLPTGLYGMVGDTAQGPFELLNQTGLVAMNPINCPYQAYSWFVAADLSVSSFIDLPEGELTMVNGFEKPIGNFVGALAPDFMLQLNNSLATPIFNNTKEFEAS